MKYIVFPRPVRERVSERVCVGPARTYVLKNILQARKQQNKYVFFVLWRISESQAAAIVYPFAPCNLYLLARILFLFLLWIRLSFCSRERCSHILANN